jgi:hypothetical protein
MLAPLSENWGKLHCALLLFLSVLIVLCSILTCVHMDAAICHISRTESNQLTVLPSNIFPQMDNKYYYC